MATAFAGRWPLGTGAGRLVAAILAGIALTYVGIPAVVALCLSAAASLAGRNKAAVLDPNNGTDKGVHIPDRAGKQSG